MNVFVNFLIILLLINFPMYLYFFYIAYNKNIDKEENKLYYIFTIVTSYYLISKYIPSFDNLYIYSLDILLFLAFISKKNFSIILVIILNVFFYYNVYDFPLTLLIIEYTLYFIIYKFTKENRTAFFFLFILLKTLFMLIDFNTIYVFLNFYLMTYICFVSFELGEEIMRYHNSIKDIENDKLLYKSLFQITHEIKNPIAVCKGYLDMYNENIIETHKYIPIVKSEIERTLILLEDFLSMHHLKINKEEMDISLLLEDVYEHFKFICNEKNIDFIIDDIDDEIYICADYNRLFQVLLNMIKNSIEALKNKKNGKIYISLKETKESIFITIEDNGEGMNQEVLNKVKEPFFSTKDKGSGLGVCLSNQIIEAHNGYLFYESSIEDGTKVTIQLKKEA